MSCEFCEDIIGLLTKLAPLRLVEHKREDRRTDVKPLRAQRWTPGFVRKPLDTYPPSLEGGIEDLLRRRGRALRKQGPRFCACHQGSA